MRSVKAPAGRGWAPGRAVDGAEVVDKETEREGWADDLEILLSNLSW